MRSIHKIINEIEHKWCGCCKNYHSIDMFGKSSRTCDKLRPTCKSCLKQKNAESKDKRTEYNKAFWHATKEKQKEKKISRLLD